MRLAVWTSFFLRKRLSKPICNDVVVVVVMMVVVIVFFGTLVPTVVDGANPLVGKRMVLITNTTAHNKNTRDGAIMDRKGEARND